LTWIVKIKDTVFKELKKLSKPDRVRVIDYIENRILKTQDPRELGKPLSHINSRFWRYRVGKFRIICAIQDKEMSVLVVSIGKRDSIYVNVY